MDRTTENDAGIGGGMSEVHAEVSLEPSKGVGMSGKFEGDAGLESGAMAGGAAGIGERATEMAGQARDRATEMAGQARDRAGEMLDQAQTKLQESGLMERIERNPLAALGVAFGIGFVLAGSTEANHSSIGKAKNQLKGAIMGGLSAAIAQEARSLVGMQGGGGLGSLFGEGSRPNPNA